MVVLNWPFKLSFRQLLLILTSVTCLNIACYIVFMLTTARNSSLVTGSLGNLRVVSNTRTLNVQASRDNATVWRNTSSLTKVRGQSLKSQTANVSGTFQQVGNSKIWMYSAYFELTETDEPYIKGFGISLRQLAHMHIYCHVSELGRLIVIVGKMSAFKDSHWRHTSYTSTYFLCRLSKGSRPEFVSLTLSKNKSEKPANQLPVFYPQPRKYDITVCHPALYGPYNEPFRIIQSIELNRVLGAEHAFIYNYNVSKEAEIVLQEYEKEGFLTVLPWPVPAESNAWYYAQHTAINDCVYRNIQMSAYVAVVDLDEFIIPANTSSWTDMIRQINSEYYRYKGVNKPLLGSMAFSSSVFQTPTAPNVWKQIMKSFSFTEEEEDIITRFSLFPLLYFERNDPPFPFPVKSKNIVRPDLVHSVGIHNVQRHKDSAIQYIVSNKTAIVNHYSTTFYKHRGRIFDLNILKLKEFFFPPLKLAINKFAKLLV